MKWYHAGIQVRDLQEGVQFYQNLFGFHSRKYFELPGEKILFLKRGEITIEIIEGEEALSPFHSVHMCWEVQSIDCWVEKLAAKGLFPSEGPLHLENGWRTVFYEGLNQEIIERMEQKKGAPI
jgi:lactoylglutathione lyase